MLAAMCDWHKDHVAALAELDRRLDAGEQLRVAAPALVEAYAMLTRLPAPHRVTASAAQALMRANFLNGARQLVALDSGQYHGLLDRAPALGVLGGTTYDMVIAQCARTAKVEVLLTFNARHFERLADDNLAVVVPAEPTSAH